MPSIYYIQFDIYSYILDFSIIFIYNFKIMIFLYYKYVTLHKKRKAFYVDRHINICIYNYIYWYNEVLQVCYKCFLHTFKMTKL